MSTKTLVLILGWLLAVLASGLLYLHQGPAKEAQQQRARADALQMALDERDIQLSRAQAQLEQCQQDLAAATEPGPYDDLLDLLPQEPADSDSPATGFFDEFLPGDDQEADSSEIDISPQADQQNTP